MAFFNRKDKKSDEKQSLEIKKARLTREWEADFGARKNIDWKWFLYDLFVNGNHYAKWEKGTQQIISNPKETGRPRIVINKTRSTLRVVRNYAVRNKPRAEATPHYLTPENIAQTVKINLYLDFIHDKLGLRRKLKESLWHALKYSVGFWQVVWNESADNGHGEIEVNVVDPFDLYWESCARSDKEARRVTLAVRRTIPALLTDSKYEKYYKVIEQLKTDSKLAASSLKERLLKADVGESPIKEEKGDGTVIVREHWYIEKDGSVWITTMAGDEIIRDEKTDLKRLPFFRLCSDVEPLSMYGYGWVKDLIPVNKLLNMLESSVAEWNDIMNRGKWVMDKGAGVKLINNEHGQIIEKKRGYDVHQESISPLANAIFEQINNTYRYIEDIGGAHDAMLGRVPTGAKSGKSIEALQVGDSNNLSEVVENIEEFLEEVYEYILYLASQKYQFVRNIIPVTASGERQFIKVVGESASDEVKTDDAVVLAKENIVDVKITSWLAETSEARRETLKELFQLQAIDQQTLLEGYQIGNIANILQKTREDQQRQMLEQQTQNAGPRSGAQEAIAAIRSILTGQPPQTPKVISQEYLDYIDQFLQSPEAQKLPEQALQAIQTFRDQAAQGSPQGTMAQKQMMGQV